MDVADQRVDGLHIIGAEGFADVLGRFDLALAARAQEIQHGIVLRRIAEVVSDNRLQDMVHQILHRPDARNHLRAHPARRRG